jgi:hypothetical protein
LRNGPKLRRPRRTYVTERARMKVPAKEASRLNIEFSRVETTR